MKEEEKKSESAAPAEAGAPAVAEAPPVVMPPAAAELKPLEDGSAHAHDALKPLGEEAKPEDKLAKAEGDEDISMSMKTEFLASLKDLTGNKVEMSLYGEETENPYWNVTVDGQPVGRIHLQDQDNANQIRAGFVSDAYAENFGTAVSQVGLTKMLTLAGTRLFAHAIDEAAITERIRAKAKAEAKAEVENSISTLRTDFLKAVNLALTASDKNFYQGEQGHALKGGLFNALVQAGLKEQHAIWAVEAGFEDAPAYFDFICAKAQEFMDMPKEARESMERTILSAGKIELAKEEPQEESIVDRLVKSSTSAVAMGQQVSGENRDQIRQNLGFSPNRR